MNRIKTVGLALVAVVALGAVAAAVATATEGPWWQVEGKRLLAGETRLLLASAKENFVLKASGITITCGATSLPVASEMHIIGSTGANGGRSLEVIEFSQCTVTGNGTGCEVASGKKITTTLVLNLLGYASSTRGGPVLVLFAPETGKKFVEIAFTPEASCTVPSTAVEGNVIGLARVGGTNVEVLPAAQIESLHGEVNFAAGTKEIWIENNGVLTLVKSGFKAFGVGATLEGTALLLVDLSTGSVNWGVFT